MPQSLPENLIAAGGSKARTRALCIRGIMRVRRIRSRVRKRACEREGRQVDGPGVTTTLPSLRIALATIRAVVGAADQLAGVAEGRLGAITSHAERVTSSMSAANHPCNTPGLICVNKQHIWYRTRADTERIRPWWNTNRTCPSDTPHTPRKRASPARLIGQPFLSRSSILSQARPAKPGAHRHV